MNNIFCLHIISITHQPKHQKKNRLEPLRSFVLSLKEAEKVAQTKNYAEWRNFFRSLGSNPEIKDKTLSINWGELWDFTAKTKADFALRSAAYSPRGAVNSDKVSFGAGKRTRTSTDFSTRTSSVLVCQFQHPGKS